MILNLPGKPEGCRMAAVENAHFSDIMLNPDLGPAMIGQLVGRAMCGDRQVETTSDYLASNGFTTSPNAREVAREEVVADLTHLIGSACLGCPNRVSGNLPFRS